MNQINTMNQLYEMLNKLSSIEYPIVISEGVKTSQAMNDVFEKYHSILHEYESIPEIKSNLKSICDIIDKIIEIHKNYRNGLFKESYIIMDNLIDEYKENFIIIDQFGKDEYGYVSCAFRSRIADPHVTLQSKDIFHIPYSLRHKVGSNRFSAPGTPCLYLGSSSYICWLEAGRPAHNTFNICGFYLTTKLSILDLTVVSEELARDINSWIIDNDFLKGDIEESSRQKLEDTLPERQLTILHNIKQYLFTLPLVLACSIKVQNNDERHRNFKEEYVIPQLLLQSLIQNNIQGVKYISTRISPTALQDKKKYFVNFAFPINNSDNHNPLMDNFGYTSVINASDCTGLNALRKNMNTIAQYIEGLDRHLRDIRMHSALPRAHQIYSGCEIPFNNGSATFNYQDSVFGEIDQRINEEACSPNKF